MKRDKTVIEYLNKALRHELTAVNQYWLHYRLLDNWSTRTWPRRSASNRLKKCGMLTS
jgi:bacterioferritin